MSSWPTATSGTISSSMTTASVSSGARLSLGRAGAFVPKVIQQPDFIDQGAAYGAGPGYAWVVFDPLAHPLTVWARRGRGPAAYARQPQLRTAAVFTNGPMMGKRFAAGRK